MDTISQMLTAQTRIPKSALDSEIDALLSAYAELYSRCKRTLLSRILGKKHINKMSFCVEFGITGRQFNSMHRAVNGMISSQMSNLVNYRKDAEEELRVREKRAKTLRAQVKKAHKDGEVDKLRKLWDGINKTARRIQILKSRIKRLGQRIKDRKVKICFGSRKFFNSQHHHEANGYEDEAQWRKAWKADWTAKRSAQFSVLGSSDESGGCQGCTVYKQDDGLYTFRIRLLDALVKGKSDPYLYLTDIPVTHQKELLETVISKNLLRSEKKSEYAKLKREGKTTLKESEYLKGEGQALSYTFIKDKRGWRVLISTEMAVERVIANTRQGVIGIDFNATHISLAELNGKGQKIHLQDYPLQRLQATSRQNATQIQELAKLLVAYAKARNKPVVIESLEFSSKKAQMVKSPNNAAYNQMLSGLSYRAFEQAMHMQCLKQGVALIKVNPAYTSLIGGLKYARETKFNTHQAAAWVIGRRGMGLRDAIPKKSPVRLMGRTWTFLPPVDGKKDTSSVLQKTLKGFSQWQKDKWAEWRTFRKQFVMVSPMLAEAEFPDIPF